MSNGNNPTDEIRKVIASVNDECGFQDIFGRALLTPQDIAIKNDECFLGRESRWSQNF